MPHLAKPLNRASRRFPPQRSTRGCRRQTRARDIPAPVMYQHENNRPIRWSTACLWVPINPPSSRVNRPAGLARSWTSRIPPAPRKDSAGFSLAKVGIFPTVSAARPAPPIARRIGQSLSGSGSEYSENRTTETAVVASAALAPATEAASGSSSAQNSESSRSPGSPPAAAPEKPAPDP